MKQRTQTFRPVLLALLCLLVSPVGALAHGSGHGHESDGTAPTLHVSDAYESCHFDLHPELTQRQFRTFAAEGASVVRFQQLRPADGLGKGRWSFDLTRTVTPINDAKGAWNNTFSHPDGDHYLGDVQNIPRLSLRYGVSDRLDVGVWGSVNPLANYGFVGLDAKMTLLDDKVAALPVYLAMRPSATSVLGPDEIWFGNAGLDLTASITVAGFSPYVGLGGTVGLAVERTDEVDLDPVVTLAPVAVTGIMYRVWHVHIGAEATWSNVNTFGLTLGADI